MKIKKHPFSALLILIAVSCVTVPYLLVSNLTFWPKALSSTSPVKLFPWIFSQNSVEIRDGSQREDLTTVVSVYFSLENSKFSQANYTTWIVRMLYSVRSPLIIFTDNASIDFLRAHRNASLFRTYYVVYESIWSVISELEHERGKNYTQSYKHNQFYIDPERHRGHNSHLYAIWNSKAYLVSKVAEKNLYGSEFFIYTDAGSWREETIPGWPDNGFVRELTRILQDRMLFGQISPMETTSYSLPQVGFAGNNYIEGGFFAGKTII
jgi:hypothetical protein